MMVFQTNALSSSVPLPPPELQEPTIMAPDTHESSKKDDDWATKSLIKVIDVFKGGPQRIRTGLPSGHRFWLFSATQNTLLELNGNHDAGKHQAEPQHAHAAHV